LKGYSGEEDEDEDGDDNDSDISEDRIIFFIFFKMRIN